MTDSGLADALADYIATQTGAPHVHVEALSKLSGGAIQDNYALTVVFEGGDQPGRQEYVVRCNAPSGVSARLSRPEEFAVLKKAFEAGAATEQQIQDSIEKLYAERLPESANNANEHSLPADIRKRKLALDDEKLYHLLLDITQAKLQISNPKYLKDR